MYTRNCPSCNSLIKYSNKYTYQNSIKKNSKCKICRGKLNISKLNNDVSLGLKDNGFKGKTHSIEFKETLKQVDKSYTKAKSFRNKISIRLSGENNPMYNKSVHNIWIEKYGKEKADIMWLNKSLKQSKKLSGENNPMFGKTPSSKSGNGWKGWYRGIFFRSLHELSFLINYVDRFKMKFESGEKAKWAIRYTKPTGESGTYFPDFIINDKYMIEVKPIRLINSPTNKAKSKAAKIFCKENNLIYKIISPRLFNIKENVASIIFNEKTQIKFNEYFGVNI